MHRGRLCWCCCCMIIKPPDEPVLVKDPRIAAGARVEHDVAFYLHREFATDPDVALLHNLRLEDPQQPEADGRPGVCQVDHMVLHRWGAFIVESKSFASPVTVELDASGGDVWTREYQGRRTGFASPIQQAKRQADFIRAVLQRNSSTLRRAGSLVGDFMRLAAGGETSRAFGRMPLQFVIAYGVNGLVTARRGWKPPARPFRTFVSKADLVPSMIRQEFERHRSGSRLLGPDDGQYGIWSMTREEMERVGRFLADCHAPLAPRMVAPAPRGASPPPSPPPLPVSFAACKTCREARLEPMVGRFGPYWKCSACGTNTSVPATCSRCQAERTTGAPVEVHRDGNGFARTCGACGWVEALRPRAS